MGAIGVLCYLWPDLSGLFYFRRLEMENRKESVSIDARWIVECRDGNGNLKWKEDYHNLVVTVGRNALLDNTFNAAAGSVAWYVGLKGTGTPAAADTLASHATWSEVNPYSGNRPAWTKNAAASAGAMSNSSSKASFTINADLSVYGAFLASAASGTSGTLFGAGDFTAPRAVISGDSLSVQVDLSITAS
jgi:hypothetical protein